MFGKSFSDLHIEGGLTFMFPLSILAFLILAILVFVIFSMVKKNELNPSWFESIKNIGGLAAVWGTLSTIFGLFNIFRAIESSMDDIPLQMIAGGLQTALITIIYGVLIFCISLFLYTILKAINSQKAI